MIKQENGFTLIEMLIVLAIISVLIILVVPNLGKSNEEVHEQGCDALVSVVQAQVYLYHLDNGFYPAEISDLVMDNYIRSDQVQCANGKSLTINNQGEVNAT